MTRHKYNILNLFTVISIINGLQNTSYARIDKKLVFSGPKGLLADIGIEILKIAYKKLNIEIKIEHHPTKRSLLLANNGEIDGEVIRIKNIIDKYPNLKIVNISTVQDEIVGFSKKNIDINGWKSLEGYQLGALAGIKAISRHISGSNVRFNTDIESVFKMLHLDRIEIAVASRLQGNHVLSKHKFPNIKAMESPLARLEVYHFLHLKHKDLIPKIENILSEMKTKNELENIRKRFIK